MEDKSGDRQVEGACLCGVVRFAVSLPSRFCAHCHCPNCRRAHGAAFVTWAGFKGEQVRLLAGVDQLCTYLSDSGATRSFCSQCGSPLFYESPRWPGEVHVALASLSGPIDRQPTAHVYVDDRAPWWHIADTLPQYGGESGMEGKK
jgi:hypothetical protein